MPSRMMIISSWCSKFNFTMGLSATTFKFISILSKYLSWRNDFKPQELSWEFLKLVRCWNYPKTSIVTVVLLKNKARLQTFCNIVMFIHIITGQIKVYDTVWITTDEGLKISFKKISECTYRSTCNFINTPVPGWRYSKTGNKELWMRSFSQCLTTLLSQGRSKLSQNITSSLEPFF